MGGRGSGRRNGKPTVEGRRCVLLPIGLLIRNGLSDGQSTTIKFESAGSRFWADIEVDLTERLAPRIVLRYLPRTQNHGFVCERQEIDLTWTGTAFGGRRWWFVCPKTGKRVGVLYLPEDERKFLSREAHGLAYRSQRMTTEQRHREKRSIAGPMSSRR
jgi:hypothetical protein